MNYAARTRRPPRTLTDAEIARLLKVSGEHRDGFRDHVIISLALGTGLRESEIAALELRDVTSDGRRPKRTIHLRVFKRAGAGQRAIQSVVLPDSTFYKLEKYLGTIGAGYLDEETPLFRSRFQRRISTRRIRSMFQAWQRRARFDRPYPFHALRHTAITNVRRRTGDIRIAQRLARHARIDTTTIYDEVSDQELAAAVREQPA